MRVGCGNDIQQYGRRGHKRTGLRTENDWVMTRLVSLVLAGWVITVVWRPNGLFIPDISVWLSDVLSCCLTEFSLFVFQFAFPGCIFFIGILLTQLVNEHLTIYPGTSQMKICIWLLWNFRFYCTKSVSTSRSRLLLKEHHVNPQVPVKLMCNMSQFYMCTCRWYVYI